MATYDETVENKTTQEVMVPPRNETGTLPDHELRYTNMWHISFQAGEF
jgi:hypothetical protein